MRGKLLLLFPILMLALSGSLARGQGSLGPIPKKARTLADYQPSTLREIASLDSDDEKLPKGSRASKYSDLIPFRVSVTYTGLARPLSPKGKAALFRWAQCCAGNPDQFTKSYETEMRFSENRTTYWLAVEKRSLPDFAKELKKGQVVNLYLIRVAARRRDGKPGSLLLVERFSTATDSARTKQTVDGSTILRDLRDRSSAVCFWLRAKRPDTRYATLLIDFSLDCF
jgi:hypothetical protein